MRLQLSGIELVQVIGSGIIAGILHTVALKGMIDRAVFIPGWVYAGIYILGPVILACGFLVLKRKERSLFAVLSLFLGIILPFAGIISVLSIFLYRMSGDRTREKSFEDEMEMDDGVEDNQERIRKISKENEEQLLRRQMDVESFSDILNSKNANLKRDAIEKLSLRDNKESIFFLKRTLANDTDAEIRFFAANALKVVEESFQNQIQALVENIEQDPSGFDNHLKLARLYLRLFRAHLSGESIQQFCLLQASDAIASALKIQPHNIDALIEGGKIKIAQRQYKEALGFLEQAEQLAPTNWQVLIWRCEAEFFLGNFPSIKKNCTIIAQENPPWKLVNNVTQFWLANA